MSDYLDSLLNARTDAKRRPRKRRSGDKCGSNSHWVDDRRVEGGGYCRKNRSVGGKMAGAVATIAGGAALAAGAAIAGGALKRKTTQANSDLSGEATRKGAIALGVVGIGAGIVGTGLGAWATWQGVHKEVERVQQEADAKANQAIAEEARKLKAESEAQLADAVAAQAQTIRQQIQAETEAQFEQAIATQVAAEIETRTQAIQQQADQETERRVAQARKEIALESDRKLQEGITQTQIAERQQFNEQLVAARRGMAAEVSQEVEQRSQEARAEMERQYKTRLPQARSKLEAQFQQKFNNRLQQREIEIRDRTHQEALAQIAQERAAALHEAREQVLAATQPKARHAGDLVDSDKDGIALAASVWQGMNLSTVTPANQDRRIQRAAERMVNRHLEQAIADLNASFRDRTKAIQQLGGGPSNSRKAMENRLRIRWEAMERALLSQTRREIALDDAAVEQRKKLTAAYKELMKSVRESDYSPESITAFDRRSGTLAKQVRREMNTALRQILDAIRLDSQTPELEGRSTAYLAGYNCARLDAKKMGRKI